jgi:hypothetical protein
MAELSCLVVLLVIHAIMNTADPSVDYNNVMARSATNLVERVDALVSAQANLTSLLVTLNSNRLVADSRFLEQATNFASKADTVAAAQSNLAGALVVMNNNQMGAGSAYLRQATNQIAAINSLQASLQTISIELKDATNMPTAVTKVSSEIEALRLELPKLQVPTPTNKPSCFQRFLLWFKK